MENEYPPIVHVDENGSPIGPIPYESAHPADGNGLRHLVAGTIIFKDSSLSQILVTKRSENIDYPGRYEVQIGGHGIWILGENRAQTPRDIAIKEIQEEMFTSRSLPKELKDIRKIASFLNESHPSDREYVHLFVGEYSGPYYPSIDEISDHFFRDIREVYEDIKRFPQKYGISARLFLEKFFENFKKEKE